MEIAGLSQLDNTQGNEGAAAQAMPKEAMQSVEALSMGADVSSCADAVVAQCGSPEQAVQDLEKVAASPEVPKDLRDAASDLIKHIEAGPTGSDFSDSSSVKGGESKDGAQHSNKFSGVDVQLSNKDRDAVAGAAGVQPVAPVDQMANTDFSMGAIHSSQRTNHVV